MSAEMKPLAAVMAELAALLKARASGVMYVVTDDGRFAQMRLRGGQLDEVSFKAKFNDEAIRLLAQVATAKSRFEQVFLTPGAARHAPVSAEALQWMLGGFAGAGPGDAAAPLARHTPTPQPAPAVAGGLRLPQRAAIEQVALTYLGPFASILCEEAFAGSTDIDKSLQQIASNCTDPAEAARFLAEARAAIAKAR
ncbi:MAG TPA: hypothetical protein VF132_05595 [Rudaea sp.]